MSQGNTTEKSKYELVTNWSLPTTGDCLHLFVSLCNYYSKLTSFFQLKVIPLHPLHIKYHRTPIPTLVWTSDMKSLFNSTKANPTSSPVLARNDSTLPTFLKTDWSNFDRGFIIMQPDIIIPATDIKIIVKRNPTSTTIFSMI